MHHVQQAVAICVWQFFTAFCSGGCPCFIPCPGPSDGYETGHMEKAVMAAGGRNAFLSQERGSVLRADGE